MKSENFLDAKQHRRRSREGAWIEILFFCFSAFIIICRSREGAWIEIAKYYDVMSEIRSLP